MRSFLLVLAVAAGLFGADAPERDPRKQPFASNSIWNMPIGSGARYVAANFPAVPGGNGWASMPGDDQERIFLTPTAPLTDIYKSKGWSSTDRAIRVGGVLASVPMPSSFLVPASSGNECAGFLQQDGRTLVQVQPLCRNTANQPALALRRFPDVDLYGPGSSGAHGGSDLSAIGGCIRLGELRPGQQGPRHAIKVAIYAKQLLYKATTRAQAFRWPATTCDSYALGWYGTEGNNSNAALKMGALLAIPPSVSIAGMGLQTEPARQLAWTLQNYGAYVVDDTYAPGFVIDTEEGAAGSFRVQFKSDYAMDFKTNCNANSAWSRDMQKLHQALHVVDNNGPTSIGGGGTPRQPLAPPLADPAYPVPGSMTVSGPAGAVRVGWSDPSTTETGFEVWRRPSDGYWSSVATLAANVTAWTDAGATAGVTWQYRVRLIKAPNVSPWSPIVSITPSGGNTAPTISAVTAQTAIAGIGRNVSFTVGDAQTVAGALVVTATSANAVVVPASGLVLGGGGADRVLTIMAVAGGSADITLTVKDGGNLTASRTFTVSVAKAPTISSQPQSATVVSGGTARFSVTASGVPAPTYQWQKNGVSIPGATAASYTTPATTGSDTGATFRVVVSNSAGSVVSGAASLTVLLPAGWSGGDVGSVGIAGTFAESGGTWTVTGSGADIWNAADGCAFARRTVSGDVRITARVAAMGDTNAWAKAGVMIRESGAAGSRHAFTCVTPGNGIAFQRRPITDGASSHTAGPSAGAPYWVRLERIGNTLIGSCSTNGTSWTEIRRETIAMQATVLVGLAVTAHANGAACTATFTNVEVVTAPVAIN